MLQTAGSWCPLKVAPGYRAVLAFHAPIHLNLQGLLVRTTAKLKNGTRGGRAQSATWRCGGATRLHDRVAFQHVGVHRFASWRGVIGRAKSPNGHFYNWFIFSMFSALGRENAKLFPLLSISSQLWEMYALASSKHGILLDIILAYFGGGVKRKMPGRGARPVDAGSAIRCPETAAAKTKMHHSQGRERLRGADPRSRRPGHRFSVSIC